MRRGAGSTDFLALWDEGAELHPLDRALGLIAAVEGMPREAAAGLSVDARNRALFRIAERLFGEQIRLTAACPECGDETELSFSTADALEVPPSPERIALAGGSAWCRPPTSSDLAAALAAPDPERALLAGVVEAGSPDSALLAEADNALAAHAGLADVTLAHRCERCGTEEEAAFDVLDYLWRRIVAEARRLLSEVHIIASAYGWSSEDILSLSPARRAAHIGIIEA